MHTCDVKLKKIRYICKLSHRCNLKINAKDRYDITLDLG